MDIDVKCAPITLLPDQTSPLAMITTEALSNAIKYGGPGEDGIFRLKVRLSETIRNDKTRVTLVIENTIDTTVAREEGTGLGRRLIAAFASQLDAEHDEFEEDGRYILKVAFEYKPFTPE